MTDTKNILMLLCKQINLCTGIFITPEHLQLAKYNKHNDDSIQSLWSVLHILSQCAVDKINPELSNFQQYGEIKSTKIYFAYLGYDVVEFYGLTEKSVNNSRTLLLAFGWLLAKHDCLRSIINKKLIESVLGRECIHYENNSEEIISHSNNDPSVINLSQQINLIVYKCNTINNNLKEISELIDEKINLINRIHSVTLNSFNLPYLSVPELFLLKKLHTQSNNHDTSCEYKNHFDNLHNIGILLKSYENWIKNEEIFFNWMETVLDDSKSDIINLPTEHSDELLKITHIIRHLIKKRIHTMKSSSSDNKLLLNDINSLSQSPCASRFLRINNKNSFNNNNINNSHIILQQLDEIHKDINSDMTKFNSELKFLIKSIPNCLQV